MREWLFIERRMPKANNSTEYVQKLDASGKLLLNYSSHTGLLKN
jgi:hypothetical protein